MTTGNNSIYLSHIISNNTPCYGGASDVGISRNSSIKNGDSSNSLSVNFKNHIGTHIDFPLHFSDKGKSLTYYNSDFWVFNNIVVIEYPAKSDEIITTEKLRLNKIPAETDFLIIKTGFQKHRGTEIYWNNNPGLTPKLAEVLKNKFHNLRVVGFDFISLSSYQNRSVGRESHKAFLVENDILVIEDMKLDELSFLPKKVIVAPLQIDNADGVPVTIFAFNA